jgi:hypothetical protein
MHRNLSCGAITRGYFMDGRGEFSGAFNLSPFSFFFWGFFGRFLGCLGKGFVCSDTKKILALD